MLNPMVADMLDGLMSGSTASLNKSSGSDPSVKTDSFQQIFDSIQSSQNQIAARQNTDRHENRPRYETIERRNDTDRADRNEERAQERVYSRRPDNETDQEKGKTGVSEVVPNRAPEEIASDQGEQELESAVNRILEKLKKMADENPEELQALLANLENMSFEDLLSGLGFSTEEVTSLTQQLNISGPVPEMLTEALKSGDIAPVAATLRESGDPKRESKQLAEVIDSARPDRRVDEKPVETKIEVRQEQSDKPVDEKRASQVNESAQATQGKPEQKEINKDGPRLSPATQAKVDAKGEPVAEAPKFAPNSEAAAPAAAQQAAIKAAATSTTTAAPKVTATQQADLNSVALNNKTETVEARERTSPVPPRHDFSRALIEQVAEKARINIKNNGSTSMVLRLDPPSLGKIDMRIVVEENSVRAVLMADNREVKAAIEQNLNSLRASLNANGLKVDEINVTTADDGGFRFQNEQAGNGQSESGGRHGNGGTSGGRQLGGPDESPAPTVRRSLHQGALDLVV